MRACFALNVGAGIAQQALVAWFDPRGPLGEEANAEARRAERMYAVTKRDFAIREGFDYGRLNVETQSQEFLCPRFSVFRSASAHLPRNVGRFL